MTLTDERIQQVFARRPVRFYGQVDSTNDIAADWLREGAETGSVVLTDEQRKGRGRMGRVWYTPPGAALALSVILRPAVDTLTQVSMLGALAVAELCESLGAPDVGIKWPNDVQIAGRKVSGVLPEAIWEGDHLLGVVLGMGVNVRMVFDSTPLAQSAISLEPALGRPLDRLDVLVELLDRVDFWTARLGSMALFDGWRSRLTTLGQAVSVVGEGQTIGGVAETVDEQGAIYIRSDDGQQHRIVAGDIAMG